MHLRRAWTAALACALGAALVGCDQTHPAVRFQAMTIQRLGPESADYLATCQVANPNGFAMQVEEVRWTLTGDGGELVSGTIARTTELPASKTVPFRVHLELPHRMLDRAGLAEHRQFRYHFGGQFRFSGPLGSIEVPFTTTGHMPIIRAMEVAWKSIHLIGVSETRVGLAIEADISNPNEVPLTPSSLVGQLLINERSLVNINTDLLSEPPVPPRQTVRVRIPVWVSSPEVGVRTLSELITAPDSRFRLVGSLELRLADGGDVNELLAASTASPAPDAAPATQAGEMRPGVGAAITGWPLP